MKRKIVCFFIGALFIFSVVPITQALDYNREYDSNTTPISGYLLFGFMQHLNPGEYNGEFEVVSFLIMRGNGEKIRLDEGEKIQMHGPIFCIAINNFFFGYIGDYEIIG